MFRELARIFTESMQGPTGKYSHARVIAMLVAFAATIFMWKLIILGGMSLEYFIAYLAYGTGHQTLNKFLDKRGGGTESVSEEDKNLPKPPKA